MALTIREIESAKPAGKPYKVTDGGGLCLLIPPSGAKLWRWRYYFDGKEKMMSLGEYPRVSLKDAPELPFAARKVLASAIDPMAERKAEGEAKQKVMEARQREAESSFENASITVSKSCPPKRFPIASCLKCDDSNAQSPNRSLPCK